MPSTFRHTIQMFLDVHTGTLRRGNHGNATRLPTRALQFVRRPQSPLTDWNRRGAMGFCKASRPWARPPRRLHAAQPPTPPHPTHSAKEGRILTPRTPKINDYISVYVVHRSYDSGCVTSVRVNPFNVKVHLPVIQKTTKS